MTNDPTLDPLPADVVSVLAEDDAIPALPADVRARLIARVGATLGISVSVSTVAASVAPGPTSATGWQTVLARRGVLAVSAFVLGGAVGAAWHAGSTPHIRLMQRPAVMLVAPIAVAMPATGTAFVDATAPAHEAPPAPLPLAPLPPAPSSPSTAPLPETPANTLAQEQRAIDTAHTALSRGQADAALEALRRHARLFPNGQLAEERESMLVQALVAAGRFDAAREQSIRFRQRFPLSMLQPVVDEALHAIP